MDNNKIDKNKISEILELNKKEIESFEEEKNKKDINDKDLEETNKNDINLKKDSLDYIDNENNKDFNYYDKNIKKNKYYEELEKEAEKYLYNAQMPTSNGSFKNIHKPLLKILIVFILSLFFIKAISSQIIQTPPEITGLWLDEYDNYYEIYDNHFEMNIGDPSKPFYIGEIQNIIKTETGFIVLTKGIKYEVNTNGEYQYNGEQELVFTLKDYKENLKDIMIANIGTSDYKISRVEMTPKTEREGIYN